MPPIKLIIILAFLTFGGNLSAQTSVEVHERALEIRKIKIESDTIPKTIIDNGKKYPCFLNKDAALLYFNSLTLLRDLEIVYVISTEVIVPGVNDKETLIFTINEK